MINGVKPPPDGFIERALKALSAKKSPPPAVASTTKQPSVLAEALVLLERGWSVLPQEAGKKKPHVKWIPFQDTRPTSDLWQKWARWWPEAGLAVVLGPISGIFVIDVDGEEAHKELLRRLGEEPLAPKVFSGSREPFRYHLFFQHPDKPTKSKSTPWYEKLEFRGTNGLAVLPPSLHRSGKRYAWAQGRSLVDLPLPEVPAAVLAALSEPKFKVAVRGDGNFKPVALPGGLVVSPRTKEFLTGRFKDGSNWNSKLFNAACDLCGRGVLQKKAERYLLAGACPYNAGEEELALKTIASAYSEPRIPSRL